MTMSSVFRYTVRPTSTVTVLVRTTNPEVTKTGDKHTNKHKNRWSPKFRATNMAIANTLGLFLYPLTNTHLISKKNATSIVVFLTFHSYIISQFWFFSAQYSIYIIHLMNPVGCFSTSAHYTFITLKADRKYDNLIRHTLDQVRCKLDQFHNRVNATMTYTNNCSNRKNLAIMWPKIPDCATDPILGYTQSSVSGVKQC